MSEAVSSGMLSCRSTNIVSHCWPGYSTWYLDSTMINISSDQLIWNVTRRLPMSGTSYRISFCKCSHHSFAENHRGVEHASPSTTRSFDNRNRSPQCTRSNRGVQELIKAIVLLHLVLLTRCIETKEMFYPSPVCAQGRRHHVAFVQVVMESPAPISRET